MANRLKIHSSVAAISMTVSFNVSDTNLGVSNSSYWIDDTDCRFWLMKLGELKLGELLDTPPPGLDEAIAISKVILSYYLILLSFVLILSCFAYFSCLLLIVKGVYRSFNSWNHPSITCSPESCLILHQR